jgi:hypothetical protein
MDLPVTSEKILMALKAKEDTQTDRFVAEIPLSDLKLLDIGREISEKWEQNFKK